MYAIGPSSKATSLTFGEYNLLGSVVKLQVILVVQNELSYDIFAIRFSYKRLFYDCFAPALGKMAPETVIRPI